MVTITPGQDQLQDSLGLTKEQNLIINGMVIKALKLPTMKQVEKGELKEEDGEVSLDEVAKECAESLEKHGLNNNNGLFMLGYVMGKILAITHGDPMTMLREADILRAEIAEKGIEI